MPGEYKLTGKYREKPFEVGFFVSAEDIPDFDLSFVLMQFVTWHHSYEIITANDELLPEVNTLFAIWQTYLFETAMGTVFDADEEKFGWKIPAETVKNAVSYLYDLDGGSIDYDEFYINTDEPDYFWLPDGFSPGNTLFWSIPTRTEITVNNDGIYILNAVFYDDADLSTVVRTFSYEFEQVLYKDVMLCFRFIGASRIE
jgi:hypothetical protein